MSTGTRALVIVLAILAALFEIFGTVTVFLTYRRSANLGASIVGALASAEVSSESGLTDTEKLFLKVIPPPVERSDVQRIKDTSYESIKKLSKSLEPKWWITLGLWAYVLGAVLGLAAAIVAVS